ncbi:hypothetical protein JOL62DRAFT_556559 [Phyllosticta paracitricarpa]|uniref:Uncharacterized protein n=1 Tax=Phyllosticta paracitricarpa TaxID=2016321 RepID=A0ABR1N6D4_9PEZI
MEPSSLMHPNRCEAINRLFINSREGSERPTLEASQETLRDAIQSFDEVILVIDVVEKAGLKDRRALLNWIKETHDSRILKLHVLVSSRQERDIELKLEKLGNPIRISESAVSEDIRAFVGDKIRFRLAALRLKATEEVECFEVAEFADALAKLRKDFNHAYSRILGKLPEHSKDGALRLLQWLMYSGRKLHLDQAVELLAVDLLQKPHINPNRRLIDSMHIARYFPSLNISSQNTWIHFLRKGLDEVHASALLVRINLAVFNHLSMESPLDYPNVGFWASKLINHANLADKDLSACEGILDFLGNIAAMRTWLRFFQADERSSSGSQGLLRHIVAKWYSEADRSSLPMPLKVLESVASPVNHDEVYWKATVPLCEQIIAFIPFDFYPKKYSSCGQSKELVTLLLDHGAHLSATDGQFGTALEAAAENSNRYMINQYLNKLNAQSQLRITPAGTNLPGIGISPRPPDFLDQSLWDLKSRERRFGGKVGPSQLRRSTISSSRPAMKEPDADEETEEHAPKRLTRAWTARLGMLFLGAGSYYTRGWSWEHAGLHRLQSWNIR